MASNAQKPLETTQGALGMLEQTLDTHAMRRNQKHKNVSPYITATVTATNQGIRRPAMQVACLCSCSMHQRRERTGGRDGMFDHSLYCNVRSLFSCSSCKCILFSTVFVLYCLSFLGFQQIVELSIRCVCAHRRLLPTRLERRK